MRKTPPAIAKINTATKTQLRSKRTKLRALKHRHDALIDRLARSLSEGGMSQYIITDREAFVFAAANLKGAKSVAARIARRALLQSCSPLPQGQDKAKREVPRPTRIVIEDHRPTILPALVPQTPPEGPLSIEKAITAAKAHSVAKTPAFALLDAFKATTDLPWDSAATLLFNSGILHERLSVDTISMAAAARCFWDRWQLARDTYQAAVHLGQVEAANGEWGLIEADQVGELLPRFSVPKSALRNEWLVRLIPKLPTSLIDLDFHAVTYTPLFTVPM